MTLSGAHRRKRGESPVHSLLSSFRRFAPKFADFADNGGDLVGIESEGAILALYGKLAAMLAVPDIPHGRLRFLAILVPPFSRISG